MAQMKEQFKAPKIELRIEEIVNLSDAEFKTLVIKMLTEMVEFGHKIEEKEKAIQSEIKRNIQGTNSEGKEARTQIMIWNKRRNKHSPGTERRNKNSKK